MIMRASDPAMHAMRLRVGIRRALNDAATTTSPVIRAESLKSACGALSTWMELVGHPKRPAATSAKGLKPVMDLELPTDLVQMAEESNPPDSTEPETR